MPLNARGYDIRERMANRFEVDQRAALFGARGRQTANGSNRKADVYAANAQAMMEQQNEAQIEDLENKVGILKEISMGINKEVKDSNNLLDGMGIDFDRAGNLLKGTMGQLKTMIANKSGKHMWQLAGFFVLIIFLLYWLIRFGSGGAVAVEDVAQANPTEVAPMNASSTAGGT